MDAKPGKPSAKEHQIIELSNLVFLVAMYQREAMLSQNWDMIEITTNSLIFLSARVTNEIISNDDPIDIKLKRDVLFDIFNGDERRISYALERLDAANRGMIFNLFSDP